MQLETIQRNGLVAFPHTQRIIDVENVVMVFVVIAVVVCRLAEFCENAPRSMSDFVSELWVANMIRLDKVSCQLAEGLGRISI